MNDQIKSFITNIGVLCETWTITYKSFISQGLSHDEAMVHTQGFMAALISSFNQGNKE